MYNNVFVLHGYFVYTRWHGYCAHVCLHVGECCAADYQFGVTSQVSVSEDI